MKDRGSKRVVSSSSRLPSLLPSSSSQIATLFLVVVLLLMSSSGASFSFFMAAARDTTDSRPMIVGTSLEKAEEESNVMTSTRSGILSGSCIKSLFFDGTMWQSESNSAAMNVTMAAICAGVVDYSFFLRSSSSSSPTAATLNERAKSMLADPVFRYIPIDGQVLLKQIVCSVVYPRCIISLYNSSTETADAVISSTELTAAVDSGANSVNVTINRNISQINLLFELQDGERTNTTSSTGNAVDVDVLLNPFERPCRSLCERLNYVSRGFIDIYNLSRYSLFQCGSARFDYATAVTSAAAMSSLWSSSSSSTSSSVAAFRVPYLYDQQYAGSVAYRAGITTCSNGSTINSTTTSSTSSSTVVTVAGLSERYLHAKSGGVCTSIINGDKVFTGPASGHAILGSGTTMYAPYVAQRLMEDELKTALDALPGWLSVDCYGSLRRYLCAKMYLKPAPTTVSALLVSNGVNISSAAITMKRVHAVNALNFTIYAPSYPHYTVCSEAVAICGSAFSVPFGDQSQFMAKPSCNATAAAILSATVPSSAAASGTMVNLFPVSYQTVLLLGEGGQANGNGNGGTSLRLKSNPFLPVSLATVVNTLLLNKGSSGGYATACPIGFVVPDVPDHPRNSYVIGTGCAYACRSPVYTKDEYRSFDRYFRVGVVLSSLMVFTVALFWISDESRRKGFYLLTMFIMQVTIGAIGFLFIVNTNSASSSTSISASMEKMFCLNNAVPLRQVDGSSRPCIVEAVLFHYSSIGLTFSWFCLALDLYLRIVSGRRPKYSSGRYLTRSPYFWLHTLFIFVLPLVLVWYAYDRKLYGYSNNQAWCFYHDGIPETLSFITVDIPVFATLIPGLFLLVQSLLKIIIMGTGPVVLCCPSCITVLSLKLFYRDLQFLQDPMIVEYIDLLNRKRKDDNNNGRFGWPFRRFRFVMPSVVAHDNLSAAFEFSRGGVLGGSSAPVVGPLIQGGDGRIGGVYPGGGGVAAAAAGGNGNANVGDIESNQHQHPQRSSVQSAFAPGNPHGNLVLPDIVGRGGGGGGGGAAALQPLPSSKPRGDGNIPAAAAVVVLADAGSGSGSGTVVAATAVQLRDLIEDDPVFPTAGAMNGGGSGGGGGAGGGGFDFFIPRGYGRLPGGGGGTPVHPDMMAAGVGNDGGGGGILQGGTGRLVVPERSNAHSESGEIPVVRDDALLGYPDIYPHGHGQRGAGEHQVVELRQPSLGAAAATGAGGEGVPSGWGWGTGGSGSVAHHRGADPQRNLNIRSRQVLLQRATTAIVIFTLVHLTLNILLVCYRIYALFLQSPQNRSLRDWSVCAFQHFAGMDPPSTSQAYCGTHPPVRVPFASAMLGFVTVSWYGVFISLMHFSSVIRKLSFSCVYRAVRGIFLCFFSIFTDDQIGRRRP